MGDLPATVLDTMREICEMRLRKFIGLRAARLLLAPFCGLSLAFAGCGESDGRLPVYPVQGTVTLQGKPLGNALIALHPVDISDPLATSCRATTDANGVFTISTYNANDGAPAGEYKVTIECYKLKGTGTSLEPGPNILPEKYSQPTTSNLSLRVAAGEFNSPKIDLK